MKLLLTGATGFVGRNLLLQAMRSGDYERIWVPVRNLSKFREQMAEEGYAELPPAIRPFESSAQGWNLGEAAGAEHVVHCAGVIFARTWEEYRSTNLDGTLELVRVLRSPTKIVVLSSLAAAGPSSDQPRSEDQAEAPVTWYGRSKLEMERALAESFSGLPIVCLRPPMIFGPRDSATLPLFKLVRKPVHFKAGFTTKHYSVLSVDDLCEAVLSTLRRPMQPGVRVYFVAHNRVITDRELLRTAAEVSGQPSRVLPVPQFLLKAAARVIDSIPTWRATIPSLSVDRAKEIWPDRWVASSAAFEKTYGWTAKTSFPDSLRQTREWYVKSGQL